jgi:sugar phosphate permease
MATRTEPRASTTATPGGIFYGWWIAVAACLITFVGVGVGVYGPTVFLSALHDHHGWSRGSISIATTLYYLVGGVCGIFIGRWVDRRGPRLLFALSAGVMAVALVLFGQVTALWQLFPAYILLAPGMTGMSNIPVTALVTRWFVRQRAKALSVAMTGISLGGMILVPATVWVVDRWGLGVATALLAAMVLAVTLPVTAFVIKRDPADLGLGPDGDPPGTAATHTAALTGPDWTRAEAIRTRPFWLLVVSFMLGLGVQQGVLLHQLSFLEGVIGTTAAATVLSVTTGASVVGRLALGTVSDRLDKRMMAAVCFAAQGLALLVILRWTSLPVIYLAMAAFGLTMGNSYIMISLLTAECFGVKSFGSVYGLLNLFVMTGSAFGPTLIGVLADRSGGYTLPFTLGGSIALAMALLVLAVRPVPHPALSEAG